MTVYFSWFGQQQLPTIVEIHVILITKKKRRLTYYPQKLMSSQKLRHTILENPTYSGVSQNWNMCLFKRARFYMKTLRAKICISIDSAIAISRMLQNV